MGVPNLRKICDEEVCQAYQSVSSYFIHGDRSLLSEDVSKESQCILLYSSKRYLHTPHSFLNQLFLFSYSCNAQRGLSRMLDDALQVVRLMFSVSQSRNCALSAIACKRWAIRVK